MRDYDEDDPRNSARGCIVALIIAIIGVAAIAITAYLAFN